MSNLNKSCSTLYFSAKYLCNCGYVIVHTSSSVISLPYLETISLLGNYPLINFDRFCEHLKLSRKKKESQAADHPLNNEWNLTTNFLLFPNGLGKANIAKVAPHEGSKIIKKILKGSYYQNMVKVT